MDGPFFVWAASKTLPELIKGSDSPFPQKALACYSLMAKPNPSCIFNRLVLHRHRRINPPIVHRPARHPCLALFTLGVPLAPLVRFAHRSSPSVGPVPVTCCTPTPYFVHAFTIKCSATMYMKIAEELFMDRRIGRQNIVQISFFALFS